LEFREPTLVQSGPRLLYARVLGLSFLAGVWFWAAFIRGRGGETFFQVSAILGATLLIVFASALLLWVLRRKLMLGRAESSRAVAFSLNGILLLLAFFPEYLLGKPPMHARSFVLAAIVVLLCGTYLFISLRSTMSVARFEKPVVSPAVILLAVCIIYFFLISTVTLLKLHAFAYVGQDIAYFTQCLYTTLHGHLFYSNMYHDLLYSKPVSSDFAGHNQLVLFLFLPFYALHKAASTLLIVRNITVVLCAWPVYLISRRTLSPWLSLAAAMAFLLVPAVLYQNVYDFAPLSAAGLPLLFAFYFFLEGKFRPFVVALLLTLIVREDLVFVAFGLGLLALWQRRPPRWSVFPCAMALVWAFLSWRIIFPYFLHGSTSAVDSCFSYMGSTPGQMVRYILAHPRALLSQHDLVYLKQLVDFSGGVLFLPSPAWLISTPYIAINLLAEGGGCNTAMIYRHYSMIPTVILFVSVLLAADKITASMRKRGNDPSVVHAGLVFFVFAAAVTSLMFVTGADQVQALRARPWHAEARKITSLIPAQASVALPRYMLPAMANRNKLYESLRLLEYHNPDAEYVVLDKDWKRVAATEQWKSNYTALLLALAGSSQYQPIYNSPGYVIYRRCGGCSRALLHVEARGGPRE
jgi:uncharacterized membrane protein